MPERTETEKIPRRRKFGSGAWARAALGASEDTDLPRDDTTDPKVADHTHADAGTTDNDVKLARIKAGNQRIAIVGTIVLAALALAVYGGRNLTISMWGAEATLADQAEQLAEDAEQLAEDAEQLAEDAALTTPPEPEPSEN